MNLAEEIADFVIKYGSVPYKREDLIPYYQVMIDWGNVVIIRNGEKIAFVADYYLNNSATKIIFENETRSFGKVMMIQNGVLFPKYRSKGLRILRDTLKLILARHPEVDLIGWVQRKNNKTFFYNRRNVWQTKRVAT